MVYGIDVSSYQKKPDWKKVRESGKEFAILRVACSTGKDPSFEYNYENAKANGIAVGVYRFSYALSVDQAKAEARKVVEYLAGRKLEMGVWLDLEWDKQRALGKTTVRKIATEWIKVIRDAGYECNIYSNLDWYKNVVGGLDARYWIARYPANDNGSVRINLKPNIGEVGWQFSSKGVVPGIVGNVDMNVWYDPITSTNPRRNPYPVPTANLKKSSIPFVVSDYVKWLQYELREAGYELNIDGKFGSNTDLALRSYQHSKGLVEDGICGVRTRKALLED